MEQATQDALDALFDNGYGYTFDSTEAAEGGAALTAAERESLLSLRRECDAALAVLPSDVNTLLRRATLHVACASHAELIT